MEKTNLSNFNQQLKDMTQDIKVLLGENDPDILRFEASMDVLKFNARAYINFFRDKILTDNNRYHIFTENEHFFLQNDFLEYTQNNSYNFSIMNKLKNIWKQTDIANQQKIFNYFKILIYYSDLDSSIDTKEELQRVTQLIEQTSSERST